jgi:hypothetical protein
MTMLRSFVAVTLACALTACGGGGDSSQGDADSSGTPTEAASANTAAAKVCADTALALTPLADGLAGGDLESALSDAEVPAWEPSGTTPTVELALERMELELSFAKQAVELGVFGTDSRTDLQRAYDALDEACAGVGSGF